MVLTREQIRDILASIEIYGEIPMKYEYIGSGARWWAKVSKERLQDPLFTGTEIKCAIKAINGAILTWDAPEKINLVDLGCGTGEPAKIIADFLHERNIDIRYVPVDISTELLENASQLFEKNGYDVKPIHLDFDSQALKPTLRPVLNTTPTIFLFLGNTLGNNSNELRVLVNIREAMGPHDILVVGTYLYNPYLIGGELERYVRDKWSKKLLYTVPSSVLGIDDHNSEYVVEYIPEHRQILAEIVLTESAVREVEGKTIAFNKGQKIIIGRSRRYLEEELIKEMKEGGFYIASLVTDRRGKIATVGVAPRKYF